MAYLRGSVLQEKFMRVEVVNGELALVEIVPKPSGVDIMTQNIHPICAKVGAVIQLVEVQE
jgi:hypothetical protein